MKKLFVIILITSMIFYAFAGSKPEQNTASEKPIELVFWTMWDGGDVAVAQKIFTEYNQTHSNVKIEFQQQDFNQFATKLKTGMISGQGPDFAISYIGGFVTGLQADNMLVSISAEAKRLGVPIAFEKYTPAAMEATKVDGEYYAVPCDNLVRVLMYNKEILKDTGVLDAQGNLILNKGFDAFVSMMNKVKTQRPKINTLALTMRPPQLVLGWMTLYEQLGGHAFIDLKNKTCVFDDAIALEALKRYRQIYTSFVPPNLAPPADLEMFKNGQAAFYIDGAWNIAPSAAALGSKFGVTTFPELGNKNALVTTNHAFIIPKKNDSTDAKKRAILEFIKWWGENNWKWSEAGHLPAYMPVSESVEFKNMPWPKYYSKTMEVAVPIYTIPNANLHQIPATTEPIQKAMLGTITPEEAIKQIKENLNKLIPTL